MNKDDEKDVIFGSFCLPDIENVTVGVIGLGYVGLAIASAFGKSLRTIGFDINIKRIDELNCGVDVTNELDAAELKASTKLSFSSSEKDLIECDVLIVAVPTPITNGKIPDLRPLLSASELVGRCIRKNGVVVFESTVYPGATEEDCIPVIEQISGLQYNKDFFAGYSPERINPGDKHRQIKSIVKVTSGSTPEVADFVDKLYSAIIDAGTFKVSSIRVAEASKIIENAQRDVNIALINELSIIFSNLDIDTNEVLNAAATKWNFIHFKPGLVGGHCIGVDPYYLVYKSINIGFIPNMIRTAREINDGMARIAVMRLIKSMVSRDIPIKGARVLVAGLTFKENCADTRNTKVIDMVRYMRDWEMEPEVIDSWANPNEVYREHELTIRSALPIDDGCYDAVVLAVTHSDLLAGGSISFRSLLRPGGIFFDLKAAFDISESDLRL